MIRIFKKAVKFIGFSILTLLAIFMLAQIFLGFAMFWFNTSSGKNFIQTQINLALDGSGYTLSYDNLFHSSENGFTLTNLKISDEIGTIAEIDNISAQIHVLSFVAHKASLSLQFGHAIIYKLPEQQKTEDNTPTTSFKFIEAPDIFFKTLALNNLNIQTLDIRKDVMGQDMILSPTLTATISLGNNIAIAFDGQINQPTEQKISWIPQSIKLNGDVNPTTLNATLTTLDIVAADYHIDMAGRADLTHTKPLSASGHVTLPPMTEKGLSAISFELSAHDMGAIPTGALKISGTYQDTPLSLTSGLSYSAPIFSMTDVTATGPDLSAKGALELNTYLTQASGNISIDVKKIESYAALLGMDISGTATADIRLSTTDEKTQAANVNLKADNIRYEKTYQLSEATLNADITDINNPWPQKLDLEVKGAQLSDDLKIAKLTANIKHTDDKNYNLTIDGGGAIQQADFTIKGSTVIQGLPDNLPSAQNINMIVASGKSSLLMTGHADEKQIDINLATKYFALDMLPVTLPENLNTANLSGNVHLIGALESPTINSSLALNMGPTGQSIPDLKLSLDTIYQEKSVNLTLKGTGNGIRTLSGKAQFPLTFSLSPFAFELPTTTPLNGELRAELDTKTLSTNFLPPAHSLAGPITLNANLAGDISKPNISGNLSLKNGTYLYDAYNVTLNNINLQTDIHDMRITVKELSANDGQNGNLSGSGVVDLQNSTDTYLSLQLQKFHLLKSPNANGIINADLSLTGKATGYDVGGKIELGQFDIILPEQFQSDIPQLNIITPDSAKNQSSSLQNIALDIAIHAPERIFVRGWGLDAEFGGDMKIAGTLDDPQFSGDFSSVRGRYEEFGKVFTLSQAKLRFQGSIPPSPYLDIEATTKTDDVVASVLLTGPASKPSIAFSSTPALPSDEVLARILFGKDMRSITPFQAIQLTQTLRRFSGQGGGGFDPLGTLRAATGLDDIRVDTDESGQSSLGVGKYLTDKVYLEVEKGKSEASGAAKVQIELAPNISVESKIGQDAQGGGGIFWSHDY